MFSIDLSSKGNIYVYPTYQNSDKKILIEPKKLNQKIRVAETLFPIQNIKDWNMLHFPLNNKVGNFDNILRNAIPNTSQTYNE